jgi:hypothetical protein
MTPNAAEPGRPWEAHREDVNVVGPHLNRAVTGGHEHQSGTGISGACRGLRELGVRGWRGSTCPLR